jgi:hypothetical protein
MRGEPFFPLTVPESVSPLTTIITVRIPQSPAAGASPAHVPLKLSARAGETVANARPRVRARQEAYEAYFVSNFLGILRLHLFGKLNETQRLGSKLVYLYLFAEVALGAARRVRPNKCFANLA